MINRVVLMKLNDRADNSVIAEMQAHVARIGAELEKARAYHLTPNDAAGHAARGGYNWVLHSAFDDEAAMNAYREAPLHREFVGFCDPYTEDFLIAYYHAPGA